MPITTPGHEKAPGPTGARTNAELRLTDPPRPFGASGLSTPPLPESPLDRIATLAGRVIDANPSCPRWASRAVDALTLERDHWIRAAREFR